MTARKSGSRLETEIERCRSESQWDKIPELVRQLSAKLISNDDLGELLLGECKLQTYLKENPIKQGASPRGPRPKLVEVRKHLTAALDRGNLKADYLQEASLLMAKLCYVEGEYRDALGLCLEKTPAASPSLSNKNTGSPSSNRSTTNQEQEIITCYEKSGDIALLYLQEAEKALSAGIQNRSPKPGPTTQDLELGYFLETGLQRAHVIHFKNGNLTQGVGRFREILRAVENRTTQSLRMTIARQLAEILLRGMCEQSYWSPLEDPPTVSPLDDPTRQGHTHTKNYSLSRRPRVYSGENLFCPQENTEEALLLLLISESMANRDAVLSRIPEHNNDRIISLQSASVVYDLLTIALGRRGQYEMLSECLERAMKFAFEEFHLWYQLALSLMAAGKSARAVKVLKECIRLKPDDPTIPLLAVKLCIGPLHWLDEGECFGKMVIDMGEKAAEFRAKGFLAIGLVYSLKATDASLRSTQEEYQRKALGAFQSDSGRGSSLLDRAMADRRQLNAMTLPDFSDPDTVSGSSSSHSGSEPVSPSSPSSISTFSSPLSSPVFILQSPPFPPHKNPSFFPPCSVHATSIAASRVEQALSEVASSLQSSAPKHGPVHPWMTLAQIWLHAAEVYTGMSKPAEATACTQEAANLFPTSHNVLYMRGQIAELRGNVDEAKRWYEEALSINPTHVKTMQRLVTHTHTHTYTHTHTHTGLDSNVLLQLQRCVGRLENITNPPNGSKGIVC
ncbi:Tetratricopeptide repeat protein 7B [Liparis tanakae]|uniref:Tetratricopeptide repeat protein 7B n=1 Tax=Liparis tanakae TaxID=230148 RepID=A0A4Z2GYD0_9TELE|nr:Tetratricopeptide repeat protein 7B [Liparis tanakae]